MAKLVVNIKGQSEEFGLADDARDIGGNEYLTVSNGNKKQYARLGNDATKLIIRKNNQKFYVQKDPVYFENKTFDAHIHKLKTFDIYLPVGKYSAKPSTKELIVSKSNFYKVILKTYTTPNIYSIEIRNDTDRIFYDEKVLFSEYTFTISRLNKTN